MYPAKLHKIKRYVELLVCRWRKQPPSALQSSEVNRELHLICHHLHESNNPHGSVITNWLTREITKIPTNTVNYKGHVLQIFENLDIFSQTRPI